MKIARIVTPESLLREDRDKYIAADCSSGHNIVYHTASLEV